VSPCQSTKSCQMPIALRPRDNSSAIVSRYASESLAELPGTRGQWKSRFRLVEPVEFRHGAATVVAAAISARDIPGGVMPR
jgi:hypothetical protein